MGASYWFRVSMMILAFVGVIFVMRRLNSPGASGRGGPLEAITGSAGNGKDLNINLCPTRVTRLEGKDWRVFQDGMHWFREEKQARVALDDVTVEKWFSRHCIVAGVKVTPSADVHDVFKAHFVTGKPQALVKNDKGEYEWAGQSFSSSQMDGALKELGELPPVGAPAGADPSK